MAAGDLPPRTYKSPCRSCGDFRVVLFAVPAMEPGKELVLGQCRSCESVRCRYYRLIPKTTRRP